MSPSTETSSVTFFFLIPLALYSYCGRRKNCRETAGQGGMGGILTRIRRIAATISSGLVGRGTSREPMNCNVNKTELMVIAAGRERGEGDPGRGRILRESRLPYRRSVTCAAAAVSRFPRPVRMIDHATRARKRFDSGDAREKPGVGGRGAGGRLKQLSMSEKRIERVAGGNEMSRRRLNAFYRFSGLRAVVESICRF